MIQLPDVPQLERLPAILSNLAQDQNITAIWLGGSLATGTPDEHSDIDLRLALSAQTFNLEHLPPALHGLERDSVLVRRSSFGEGTAWHYLMLPDASIWDVLIYRDTREPFPEFRRVIQARGDWANKLEGGSDPSVEFATRTIRCDCGARAILVGLAQTPQSRGSREAKRHLDGLEPFAASTDPIELHARDRLRLRSDGPADDSQFTTRL
jgi:predicted nucleotidyltransferase